MDLPWERESRGLVRVTADAADGAPAGVLLTPACSMSLTAVGSDEPQSLTEEGPKRFGHFGADWEAEEVQMLTSLLQKLEASKAAVAARQRHPSGRHWARQTA